MLTEYTPKSVLSAGAELGEHPIWSEPDSRLYWLDIVGSKINRFHPQTGMNESWDLSVFPGCFAFKESGGAILAAHDGIYEVDFSTGGTELILPAAHDPEILRFNDGRTDRQGRFWAGTVRRDMDQANTAENAYYRYDSRGLTKMLTNVGLTNGTAFSPDGRIMYRAQSETRQVFAYDYDPATGTPANERLFATIPAAYGMPDGATIDSQGAYWVAVAVPPGDPAKPGVLRFLPDGTLDLFIELPVPFVTMPAFGGPNLSTLYITTARLEAFMPGGGTARRWRHLCRRNPIPGHRGDSVPIDLIRPQAAECFAPMRRLQETHSNGDQTMNAISSSRLRLSPLAGDPRWQRIQQRDKTADGQFWYSVATTGIYCRPSCPSRSCNPKNVTIHDTLEAAKATGCRACLRCRPDEVAPATAMVGPKPADGSRLRKTPHPCGN